MPAKRKQTSLDLLREIDRLPVGIRKVLKASAALTKAKRRAKTGDYIEGLLRQVTTRIRSRIPKDRLPPKASGYQDWDYALMEIRRKELKTISKLNAYRQVLGL